MEILSYLNVWQQVQLNRVTQSYYRQIATGFYTLQQKTKNHNVLIIQNYFVIEVDSGVMVREAADDIAFRYNLDAIRKSRKAGTYYYGW